MPIGRIIVSGANGYCKKVANVSIPFWANHFVDYEDWDRFSCCSNMLSSFNISIANEAYNSTQDGDHGAALVAEQSFAKECPEETIAWPIYTYGRYVRIHFAGSGVLMLDEVEILRWNPATATQFYMLRCEALVQIELHYRN